MTLVVYPPRVSGGRHCSFMWHCSCCVDDNQHGSFPTDCGGGWRRAHGRALLVVVFVDGKNIERRNPDIRVRILRSANSRTTTMMRTVASLATATAIVGTASVGIGTTGVGNVMIGNNDDGGR